MIEKYKAKVAMSKPIYVGCAILDLSKLTMLQFHYTVIEKHFKHKYNLPYDDTDSFVYNITILRFMNGLNKENKQYVGLSCYEMICVMVILRKTRMC